MWLADGDIVLIADSQGVRDSYQADGSAVEASAPLAVLVNKGTASASEVRSTSKRCCPQSSAAGMNSQFRERDIENDALARGLLGLQLAESKEPSTVLVLAHGKGLAKHYRHGTILASKCVPKRLRFV